MNGHHLAGSSNHRQQKSGRRRGISSRIMGGGELGGRELCYYCTYVSPINNSRRQLEAFENFASVPSLLLAKCARGVDEESLSGIERRGELAPKQALERAAAVPIPIEALLLELKEQHLLTNGDEPKSA